jgi:hypothetical protein
MDQTPSREGDVRFVKGQVHFREMDKRTIRSQPLSRDIRAKKGPVPEPPQFPKPQ